MLCAHQRPYTGCAYRHFFRRRKQTHFWESNLRHLCLARDPVEMLTHYTNPPPHTTPIHQLHQSTTPYYTNPPTTPIHYTNPLHQSTTPSIHYTNPPPHTHIHQSTTPLHSYIVRLRTYRPPLLYHVQVHSNAIGA